MTTNDTTNPTTDKEFRELQEAFRDIRHMLSDAQPGRTPSWINARPHEVVLWLRDALDRLADATQERTS